MRITRAAWIAALLLVVAAAHASAQSETFSRKVRVGAAGHVSISNISGTIAVSASAGDEVVIDAVKRGDRRAMDRVQIVVDESPGRVDVRTNYPRSMRTNVEVDYTVTVPPGAELEVNSISGRIHIDGVKGAMRLSTISGDVTAAGAARVEFVKTVSGAIDLSGVSHDGMLAASTISGYIHVNSVKVRTADLNSISGDFQLRDAACERVYARSLSGGFEYAGTLARNGRYEINSHSGSVRFTLADNTGFKLNASSFSGSIRSDYTMTVGGDGRDLRSDLSRGPRRDSVQATFGDGGASLNLQTFSGNITIAKK